MKNSQFHVILSSLCVISILLSVQDASAHIPAHISKEDIKTYARWLQLDDDRYAILLTLHDNYIEQRREDLFDDWRAYSISYRELIARADSGREDPATFLQREFDTLNRQRAELLVRIEQSDRAFFEQIRLILDEEALPRMQRVELGRKRAFFNYAIGSMLPGGQVDVIDLIDGLPLRQDDYDRLEREFIFEFEPRWVAARTASTGHLARVGTAT